MDESGQIPYWEDQAACANPPEEIKKGDVVMYAREFLRSTGQYTGPIPFLKGMVVDVEKKKGMPDVAHVLWNYEDPSEEVMHRVLVTNLVKKSRLHLERNPGDIHIDIGSHNENPPERVRAGQKFVFRRSGWDVAMREHCPDVEEGQLVRVIQLPSAPKPGTMGQVHIEDANTGEFLGMCSMKSLSTGSEELQRTGQLKLVKHNPPLPASALMDVATAKTVAREVEEGARPMGNLATVDHLLDRGLQKLRGSHLGNVDWQNPPLEILSDNMVGKLRVIHYMVTVPMQSSKDAEKILHTLYPAWRVRSHYSLRPDAYPGVKHAYGVQMAISHDRRNPGPGKIKYYQKRTQPLSRHNVVKAIEQLIEANTEVGNTLAMFKRRGMVSDEEYLEWKYVQQIAMMLRDDLTLARGGEMTNPPAQVEKEIYRDIVEIKAIKPDGKRYVHKFGLGSNIYGMSDGTILIRSRKGKRLWKNFKVGG